MIIYLISLIALTFGQQFLCALNLIYQENPSFLFNQEKPTKQEIPFILTNTSPRFALEIQKTFGPSEALDKGKYYLSQMIEGYVFYSEAQLDWLSIKFMSKNATIDQLQYKQYYCYFVDKREKGGHMLIHKGELKREYDHEIDKYYEFDNGTIFQWSGVVNIQDAFMRIVKLIELSQQRDICKDGLGYPSLEQISCNFDKHYEHLILPLPDMYHPPIHFKLDDKQLEQVQSNYFLKKYPGMQVFVAENFEVLEIKFPIGDFKTHQEQINQEFKGLVIMIEKDNHGFIHLILYQDDNSIVDYIEENQLGQVQISNLYGRVYIISFVASQYMKFPKIHLIDGLVRDIYQVSNLRQELCVEKNKQICDKVSQNYLQLYEIPNADKEIKLIINGKQVKGSQQEAFYNQSRADIQIETNLQIVNTLEMNHAGFICSFLKIKGDINIYSMIITYQNPHLEVFYQRQNNIIQHTVTGINNITFIVVHTNKLFYNDDVALRFFRSYVDHIQKSFIEQQIQSGCISDGPFPDQKPMQFNKIHKLIKQQLKTQFLQKEQLQDDEGYVDENEGDDTLADEIYNDEQDQYQNDEDYQDNQSKAEDTIQHMTFDEQEQYDEIDFNNDNEHEIQTLKSKNIKGYHNFLGKGEDDEAPAEEKEDKEEKEDEANDEEPKEDEVGDEKEEGGGDEEDSKKPKKGKKGRGGRNKRRRYDEDFYDDRRRRMRPYPPHYDRYPYQRDPYYSPYRRGKRDNDIQDPMLRGGRGDYYGRGDPYVEPYRDRYREPYREPYRDPYVAPYRQTPYRRDPYEPYVEPYVDPYVEPYVEPYADPYRQPPPVYRRPIPLVGQTVLVPKNPNDQDLGKFFRDVIQKLNIFADPCDTKNPRYDQYYCQKTYDDNSISRPREYYERLPLGDHLYDPKACITVFSECHFHGDSLKLCGHQTYIPKSQQTMQIKSVRAQEHYIIEFYMETDAGRTELFTIKGSQECMRYPLRIDQLLQ